MSVKKKKPSKLSLVPLGEFRKDMAAFLEKAQAGAVVLMRHNQPMAILRGVGGEDLDDVIRYASVIAEEELQDKGEG